MTKQAFLIDAVRTPFGKADTQKGIFRNVRAEELVATCIEAIVRRTAIPLEFVEEVTLGCVQQTKEQGFNIARVASLIGGLPPSIGATTVNRLCGSSLQAINQASHAIKAGAEELHFVGGVEHMGHLPMTYGVDLHPRLFATTSRGAMLMGVTAEYLAQTRGISRKRQDEYALHSHQKAVSARKAGLFDNEVIPTYGHNRDGLKEAVTDDQCVREETSIEQLASLEPAFMQRGGTVTAGNSSPLNDGASLLLMTSQEKADEIGLRPRAKVVQTASVGIEPALMGLGPVLAVKKLLAKTNLSLEQIGVIEINEAFAAQVLSCLDELSYPPEKVNLYGGAIAIGHPLGASGGRLVTMLLNVMEKQNVQYGIATMCIGMGQGIATLVELVN
ncbi:MAG: acetyl-CoA C-acyltransferase [Pirellulaceae bacterium]|nr:acetyl-CoA C-acyltransferase [Pirellulaceae bacterium]